MPAAGVSSSAGDYYVSSAAAGRGSAAITASTGGAESAVSGLDAVASSAARRSLSVALVCACNMNRSMAAHELLMAEGFTSVASFGTARKVKLPGGPSKVHVFDWGTPYTEMEQELVKADARSMEW